MLELFSPILAQYNRDLGFNLRRLRQKAQLTQAKVAERIGCETWQISSYERGQLSPSVHRILDLLGVYGVNVEGLKAYLIHELQTHQPKVRGE